LGEVNPMHQFGTDRAADVLDFQVDVALTGTKHGGRAAEDGGLALTVDADAVEGGGIDEEALAFGAFMNERLAKADIAKVGRLALWAGEFRFPFLESADFHAASGAEFRSFKNHGEARGAGDLCQPAAAMGAPGKIGRSGRAAL